MDNCPRCRRFCPILETDQSKGNIYECYYCKVAGRSLRWFLESSRLWEDTELELKRIEFVQVIIGEAYDS